MFIANAPRRSIIEDTGPIPARRCLRLFFGFFLMMIGVTAAGQVSAAIRYKTEFVGVEGRLAKAIEDASLLVSLRKHDPASLAALRDRTHRDLVRLKAVLDSEGYYDAELDETIDRSEAPYRVTVTIKPGQHYVFAPAAIVASAGETISAPSDAGEAAKHGLVAGAPARAETIIDTETAIVETRHENGWPFAKITARKVVADTATKRVTVTYTLDTGPVCRFGRVTIDGLRHLMSRYVRRRVLWAEGDVYDQRMVDKTRRELLASSLFSVVSITPERPSHPGAPADMIIKVKERVPRSVTFGGGYDTSQGLEASASWEHRNLFGGAQDVKTEATVGQSKNAVEIDYRRPDFWATNQDLVASIGFDNEILDAFHTIAQRVSLGYDWRVKPTLEFQASVQADHARINEITDSRTYTLVGLPLVVKWDNSDDPLNPTRGYRVNLTGTPYLGALGSQLTFFQFQATGTTYRKLDPDAAYVLAAQTMIGATAGASLNAIPKDHRLYAGGGGSVRGFAFQKAGPQDIYSNAIGGRSLFETSLELRIRLTERLGLVPFFDAGSDYASSMPDLSSLYEGAGLGVRYYSAIGPIRLDLATPFNPHTSDSPIQVYVGLGQAF